MAKFRVYVNMNKFIFAKSAGKFEVKFNSDEEFFG